jgi:acyl-coenzyme A synthetase/AMP-(fatty) acid ligase
LGALLAGDAGEKYCSLHFLSPDFVLLCGVTPQSPAMIAEAAIAMLACARLGAVHSVVFGGFAANELATRINDAKPKVIVSASCGIETSKVIPYKHLLDGAIDMAASKPETCIIFQRSMESASLFAGYDSKDSRQQGIQNAGHHR